MLGKIIKHEFKDTYKVMLAVYAAYFLLTIIGSSTSYALAKGYSEPNVLTISVIVFYVISSIAVYVATFVFICIRYYKTMYSAQGYLTHTLPVKGVTIFNGKLIVSTVWMIISIMFLILSVFFFVNAASEGEAWESITRYTWTEFNRRMYEETGVIFTPFFIWFLFEALIGTVVINLWIFTSFAIGQLSDKHKVALSIVTGMVLYFAFQIFELFETISAVRESAGSLNIQSGTDEYAMFMNQMMTSVLLLSIVTCAVMYAACIIINKKKLNLE
ncbi:MAG: hypothetical protein KIG91_05660 [Treponema sp.]|nr:hypothetical protein [Treponema sp.]